MISSTKVPDQSKGSNLPGRTGFLHTLFRKGLFQPLTQVLMAMGFFPAPIVSGLASVAHTVTGRRFRALRPAQQVWDEDIASKDKNDLIYTKHNIPLKTQLTGRTVHLETYQIESKAAATESTPDDNKEHYYLIHCPGNTGQCSRFFPELVELTRMFPNLTARTFNHQGVGNSGGSTLTFDDLVNGAYAQAIALLNGVPPVPPNKLIISGFSIGAATATLLVKKLNDDGYKGVKLFCDRTFDNMANVVTVNFPIIGPLLRNIPPLNFLVRNLIVRPLLWILGWNMNPADAYKKIDVADKALMYVKPKSDKSGPFGKIKHFFRLKEGTQDKRIPEQTSLATVFTDSKVARKGTGELKNSFFVLIDKLADLKNLTSFSSEDITSLENIAQKIKMYADNATTFHAAEKILSLLKKNPQEVNLMKDDLKKLIALAIIGYKDKRLDGAEKNAHDVNRYELTMREIRGNKYLKLWKDSNEMLSDALSILGIKEGNIESSRTAALAAAIKEEKTPPQVKNKNNRSASLYPAMFFASIMDRPKQQPDEKKRPSPPA